MKRKFFLIILTILATIVITTAIISNQTKTTENKLMMHASKWSASQGSYVDVSPGDYVDVSEDRQIAEAVSNSSIIEGNSEVPESMVNWAKDILGDQTSKTIVVKIGNDLYTVIIKYETTISRRSQ